ncbi:hypothetical protein [Marinoscillum furvescens]|uniref:Uncharacterized protein n=1 Tax=Marinoscillum furvescens DSM 4134 TaxID=1122208 RepID=A0A3D9KWN5_MARFU|nr:hypothetical protein [Marinoscillum furvescens]RED92813.1 hypothetical protein C7460_12830 [Marinoscillum furvescens DSM 4134]
MSRLIRRLIISGFSFLLFSSVVYAQHTTISEDDVSFEILKWHFHYYPKSESLQWVELGEGLLKAQVAFEGNVVSIIYNVSGKRLMEEVDLTDNIPVTVSYYLDERYEKYKVQSFIKYTDFSQDRIAYRMKLKSKQKGAEDLEFDENLIPVDFALVSKAN